MLKPAGAKGSWKCVWHQHVPFTPWLCWHSPLPLPERGQQNRKVFLLPQGRSTPLHLQGNEGTHRGARQKLIPGRWHQNHQLFKCFVHQHLTPPHFLLSLVAKMSNWPLLKTFSELTELLKMSLIECHSWIIRSPVLKGIFKRHPYDQNKNFFFLFSYFTF